MRLKELNDIINSEDNAKEKFFNFFKYGKDLDKGVFQPLEGHLFNNTLNQEQLKNPQEILVVNELKSVLEESFGNDTSADTISSVIKATVSTDINDVNYGTSAENNAVSNIGIFDTNSLSEKSNSDDVSYTITSKLHFKNKKVGESAKNIVVVSDAIALQAKITTGENPNVFGIETPNTTSISRSDQDYETPEILTTKGKAPDNLKIEELSQYEHITFLKSEEDKFMNPPKNEFLNQQPSSKPSIFTVKNIIIGLGIIVIILLAYLLIMLTRSYKEYKKLELDTENISQSI